MFFLIPFKAGGAFPQDWLNKHINKMHVLYHLLWQFCTRHPETLRRAHVLINVNNQSIVGAFNRGREKTGKHALCLCSCSTCK